MRMSEITASTIGMMSSRSRVAASFVSIAVAVGPPTIASADVGSGNGAAIMSGTWTYPSRPPDLSAQAEKVHEAWERVLRSDVRYRFVIDIDSLR